MISTSSPHHSPEGPCYKLKYHKYASNASTGYRLWSAWSHNAPKICHSHLQSWNKGMRGTRRNGVDGCEGMKAQLSSSSLDDKALALGFVLDLAAADAAAAASASSAATCLRSKVTLLTLRTAIMYCWKLLSHADLAFLLATLRQYSGSSTNNVTKFLSLYTPSGNFNWPHCTSVVTPGGRLYFSTWVSAGMFAGLPFLLISKASSSLPESSATSKSGLTQSQSFKRAMVEMSRSNDSESWVTIDARKWLKIENINGNDSDSMTMIDWHTVTKSSSLKRLNHELLKTKLANWPKSEATIWFDLNMFEKKQGYKISNLSRICFGNLDRKRDVSATSYLNLNIMFVSVRTVPPLELLGFFCYSLDTCDGWIWIGGQHSGLPAGKPTGHDPEFGHAVDLAYKLCNLVRFGCGPVEGQDLWHAGGK